MLGHKRGYPKDWIRCSPIDVNLWYDKPFKCVDFLCSKESADFVYDIYRSIDYRFDEKGIKYHGFWVWEFAENESYDIIIDCTGCINWDKSNHQYKHNDELLKTILRVLKPNGVFYGRFYKYTKINDELFLSKIN